MKKEKKYIEYILKQAEALLAIDSPSCLLYTSPSPRD